MVTDEGVPPALGGEALARSLTRQASRHTYYTIRLLADRERIDDAFRAYAYFRWVDDQLDQSPDGREARLAFVSRQCALLNAAYAGTDPGLVQPPEQLLLDLIRTDPRPASGLACYTRNMMRVMAFDAGRRGRCITEAELERYTQSLAVAVTEALHYFIGHGIGGADTPDRYLAVSAAHIVHMLRDTREDVDAGYYNIPSEVLRQAKIEPDQVHSPAYRGYVRQRAARARRAFKRGKAYFAQVASRRCRLAAFAYSARFEAVLDAIERNDYDLTGDLRPSAFSSARGWGVTLAAALPSRLAGDRDPGPAVVEAPASSESGRRSKSFP